MSETDAASGFSMPPGTGSPNASNVKAIATTASEKERQPLSGRELHLVMDECDLVFCISHVVLVDEFAAWRVVGCGLPAGCLVRIRHQVSVTRSGDDETR